VRNGALESSNEFPSTWHTFRPVAHHASTVEEHRGWGAHDVKSINQVKVVGYLHIDMDHARKVRCGLDE
jgi:hypothetical protein